MLRRILLLMMCWVLFSGLIFAEYGKVEEPVMAPKKPISTQKKAKKIIEREEKKPFVVDNFSDGNVIESPEWWQFGQLSVTVVNNEKVKGLKLGRKSMQIRGISSQYIAGGIGTYLGKDGFDYQVLVLRLYSPKINAGILRVELYDDDNGNYEVDIPTDASSPISDDVFVHNVLIDWEGWKEIRLPFKVFDDDNPYVGDNIMNPYQISRSGGLIQMQLVLLSIKAPQEELMIRIDEIRLEQLATNKLK